MRAIVFFLLCLCLVSANAGEPVGKSTQTIYFYGAWFNPGNKCSKELDSKYGFTRAGGGCTPTTRSKKQNRKARIKLMFRNGPGWKKRYNKELQNSACYERELLLR